MYYTLKGPFFLYKFHLTNNSNYFQDKKNSTYNKKQEPEKLLLYPYISFN